MSKMFSVKRLNFKLSTKYAGSDKTCGLAKTCYNIKMKNDKLVCSNGTTRFTLPQNINLKKALEVIQPPCKLKKIWKYSYRDNTSGERKYIMFCWGVDNKLYAFDLFDNDRDYIKLLDYPFGTTPCFSTFSWVNKDGAMFCATSDDLVYFENSTTPQIATRGTKFCSICYYKERLFGLCNTDDGLLKYTKETKLFDWSDTADLGEINLHKSKGQMRRLVPLDNGLLCIGDYEIVRVEIPRVISMTTINSVLVSGSKIYADTVIKVKDMVYFLAQDGLYCTDGYEVKKIPMGFEDKIQDVDQSYAISEAYEGKLYIAMKFDFGETDTKKNNALVEIDLNDYSYSIMKGYDIRSLMAVCDKGSSRLVLLVDDDRMLYQIDDCGTFYGLIMKRLYESADIDLGSCGKKKILDEVYLGVGKGMTLKVCSDEGFRQFEVKDNTPNRKYYCKLPGKKFWITLSGTDNLVAQRDVEMVFRVRNDI